MFTEQSGRIGCPVARLDIAHHVLLNRTLQKMRQKESSRLKFSTNVRRRPSCGGNPHSSQQIGRLSTEFVARRIEKVRVLTRSDAAQ